MNMVYEKLVNTSMKPRILLIFRNYINQMIDISSAPILNQTEMVKFFDYYPNLKHYSYHRIIIGNSSTRFKL